MKRILALGIFFAGLNSFTQEPQAMVNCSSADQKVAIQLTVNQQGKFKTLVVNNNGKLTAVSRDQLITFSGESIVFETDTPEVAILNFKNTYLSLGSISTNIFVGIFGYAPNAYQVDTNKMTPLICKHEIQ